MSNSRPADDLERKITTLLKFEQFERLSSDAEFIQKLNPNLVSQKQPRSNPGFHRIWLSGVTNGLAAAALGLIIFIGLQLLPSLLIGASLTGADLIQSKLVGAALNHNVLWQKLIIDLQQLKSIL